MYTECGPVGAVRFLILQLFCLLDTAAVCDRLQFLDYLYE